MALLDDIFEGNVGTGIAYAVGAAVLVPLLGPVLRPAAKAVIKGGLYTYDKGRELMGQLGEATGDLMAEVRSEMEGEHAEKASTAVAEGETQPA